MTRDARANIFEQAAENDRQAKNEILAGAPASEHPSRAEAYGKRFGGRSQANFGIDPDTFLALKLARVNRAATNSEIINDALRAYLADELQELKAKGRI